MAAMWLWIPILYVSVNKYPVTCVREACRSIGPGIAIVMPVVLKTSPLRMATKRYLSSVSWISFLEKVFMYFTWIVLVSCQFSVNVKSSHHVYNRGSLSTSMTCSLYFVCEISTRVMHVVRSMCRPHT